MNPATAPDTGDPGSPRSSRVALGARGRIRRTVLAVTATALLAMGCAPHMPSTSPAPPVPRPAGPQEPTRGDVEAWLDGTLPAALETEGIAGATVSVVADGEILTSRGYGYSETGTGYEYGETAAGDVVATPVDPEENLFQVGELSEPVTATAAMLLVESGELDLDTDVTEYLDFAPPSSFDTPVTLRHLLTHTGGYEERYRGRTLLDDGEVDLRARLTTDPPEQVHEPGTVPSRSEYGYALVGHIIERVTGDTFEDHVRENVLDPIGMADSDFHQDTLYDGDTRPSDGYETDDSRPTWFEGSASAPSGALSTTAVDMARFMLALLEDGEGPGPLSSESLDLMRGPGLDADTLGTLAEGPRATLGLLEEDRGGRRILGYDGDSAFFHSRIRLHPDEGTGIFVSLNSNGHDEYSAARVLDAVTEGFTDRYLPAGEEDGEDAEDISISPTREEHAAMAEGRYVSSRSSHSTFLAVRDLFEQTRVTARPDGTIVVSPDPTTGAPAAYEEIEPWVWREMEGDRTLVMRADDREVRDLGFGAALTMTRVDTVREAPTALTVLGVSLAILLLAALSWPISALVRRSLKGEPRARDGRTARVLTRGAVVCALAATALWAWIVPEATGTWDVAWSLIRSAQGLTFLGALGVLPAAVSLVRAPRARERWFRVLAGTVVLAALVGFAWSAAVSGVMAWDITY
ncbi:serine hydrolase domain-containing protein [Nocardiopsis alba]|uniref:serine hydrolase domain-containing protein n=1 Tax=Nocardiopsis alba TaxID=53437 RepID=UPI003403383D